MGTQRERCMTGASHKVIFLYIAFIVGALPVMAGLLRIDGRDMFSRKNSFGRGFKSATRNRTDSGRGGAAKLPVEKPGKIPLSGSLL